MSINHLDEPWDTTQAQFLIARQLAGPGQYPLTVLLMAAMAVADSETMATLGDAFPELAAEYTYRHWSGGKDGGGWLPGESGYDVTYDDNTVIYKRPES